MTPHQLPMFPDAPASTPLPSSGRERRMLALSAAIQAIIDHDGAGVAMTAIRRALKGFGYRAEVRVWPEDDA